MSGRFVSYNRALIDTGSKKYLIEQVFVWQNVPGNIKSESSLREFLKRRFNIDWLDNAKEFEKIENGKGLIISCRSNYLSITLNDNNTRATLKERGKKIYEFPVRKYGPVSDRLLLIEASSSPLEEFVALSLSLGTPRRVYAFVINIISNAREGSHDLYMLSKDRRFLNSLEKLTTEFIEKYQLVKKKQGISISTS